MVESRLYNQLKIPTLRLILDGQVSTSRELSEALGLELTNACDVLWRLRRWGLLRRRRVMMQKVKRSHYVYEISDRGEQRLLWLESHPRRA